ncbi:MAG: hypothetical protein AAGF66_05790 [Cyanobacteria bacterium P01_H01_bin.119]
MDLQGGASIVAFTNASYILPQTYPSNPLPNKGFDTCKHPSIAGITAIAPGITHPILKAAQPRAAASNPCITKSGANSPQPPNLLPDYRLQSAPHIGYTT